MPNRKFEVGIGVGFFCFGDSDTDFNSTTPNRTPQTFIKHHTVLILLVDILNLFNLALILFIYFFSERSSLLGSVAIVKG